MVKALAQTMVFVLELAMLGSLGYCGYLLAHGKWWGWLPALFFPAVWILLWGRWAAPRSPRKLKPPYRLVFRLTLFLIAFAWLAAAARPLTGIALFLLAMISEWFGQTARA